MKPLKLAIGLVFLSLGAHAQYVASNLRIAGKDVIEITESDVQIDTLIMDDKSRIVFLAPETKLVIKNAFIGARCTWDVSGESGEAAAKPVADATGSFSKDGLPGRNLQAEVTFRYLGNLKINAAGSGGHTKHANRYGSFALQGGKGGDGGIVSLSYGTSGFPIAFQYEGFRCIQVDIQGGGGGYGEPIAKNIEEPPPIQFRNSSQNAPMDLWGNQKAAATGDLVPRNSRAQNGGTNDIPPPLFVQSDAQGVQYATAATTTTTPKKQRRVQGQYGIHGTVGSFTYLKID